MQHRKWQESYKKKYKIHMDKLPQLQRYHGKLHLKSSV